MDGELAALQSAYPGQYEVYINRLSVYLTSNGKHYANHYATLCKWLGEDSKSKPGKNYDYTETYANGENFRRGTRQRMLGGQREFAEWKAQQEGKQDKKATTQATD